MTRMLLKRFGQGILVIVVLQTITFFLVRQLPGNPFLGERKLPQHIMDQLNNLYGLDQSAWVQYLNYWKGIILHGDFGPSLVREGVQVSDIIAQAFPYRSGWACWACSSPWWRASRRACWRRTGATAGLMRSSCCWPWRASAFLRL